MQLGEEVRSPGDRVGLTRSSRVLDQVPAPRSVSQHRGEQLAGHVELVEPREDDLRDRLLLVAHGGEVAAEDLEPAFARPDLLPEVCRAVASGIHRISGAAAVAQVERQELGRRSGEARGHLHLAVAHREVHQRAARERQERLRRLALGVRRSVEAVLLDRVADTLGEVGLQLDGRDWQAVQEQHQIDRVLVVQRIAHLTHHAQPVGLVAGDDLGVGRERGLPYRELDLVLEPQQLDAVAQHIERAALIELGAQTCEQRLCRASAVVLGERLPRLGLGRLHPRQHVGREQCARPVVRRGVALGVQPAMGGQVLADLALEGDFLLDAHEVGSTVPRSAPLVPTAPTEARRDPRSPCRDRQARRPPASGACR